MNLKDFFVSSLSTGNWFKQNGMQKDKGEERKYLCQQSLLSNYNNVAIKNSVKDGLRSKSTLKKWKI